MRSRLILLIAILMLAHLIGGASSPASAAQDAAFLTIEQTGCFIDVTFQVEDAGDYFVNFWDDGTFRGGAGGPVPAGGTMTVRYVIGELILEGAAGIGIYVENGYGAAATITYYAAGSYAVDPAVSVPCAATYDISVSIFTGIPGCDMAFSIPADGAVGTFVVNAEAYWAPGNLTDPLVTLAAGKTAWVLGVDASGEYYKIAWSCSALWVKTSTMGPNYDAVWQGHPLPTTVVQ